MKTWHIAALVVVGLIVAGIVYSIYKREVYGPFLRPPAYNTSYGVKDGLPVYGPTRKTWKATWKDEYPTFRDLDL